ncbi:MAG: hypothetical protein NZ746_03055 [Blastocatellia bacterium]|nr:hypothetical protein [Blastocatellia bacterium]
MWYDNCIEEKREYETPHQQGGRIMRKLLVLANVVALAFVLSGAVGASQKKAPGRTEAQHPTQAKVRTARGEISTVDLNARTLTLMERGKAITIAYDDQTKFTESGRPVQPSAIKSGMMATVRYAEQGGRNIAHEVHLRPAAHPAKKSKP